MKLTTKKLLLTGVAVLTMAAISACGNTKNSETTAATKAEVTTEAVTKPAETKKEVKESSLAETKKDETKKDETKKDETQKEETSVGESKTDSKVKADSPAVKDSKPAAEAETKKN